MISHRAIKIKKDKTCFYTEGLEDTSLECELSVLLQKRKEDNYIRVLNYLIDYILDFRPNVRNQQTIGFHSWLLKFNQSGKQYYDLWEAKQDGSGFTEGVDHALEVVNSQEEACKKLEFKPIFPNFNQQIVLSKGVYECYPLEAVRYSSPGHMTGWWLTTELYDGNIDSLVCVHYFHVAFERPDIVQYLALPYGYRFSTDKKGATPWFDPTVLVEGA